MSRCSGFRERKDTKLRLYRGRKTMLTTNQADPNASWFNRHPSLTLALLFAGVALALWFLFFRRGSAMLSVLQPPMRILVSEWSPLQ